MGLTHLDAGVLIGFLDTSDTHHEGARRALDAARSRRDAIAISASALAESLVSPSRQGEAAVARVTEFVERLPVEVATIDDRVAIEAARLRAKHPTLRLPDALVIATAFVDEADVLLTTDRRWPTARRLGLSSTIECV